MIDFLKELRLNTIALMSPQNLKQQLVVINLISG